MILASSRIASERRPARATRRSRPACASRCSGSPPGLMAARAGVHVRCPAAVEAAVGAAQQVDEGGGHEANADGRPATVRRRAPGRLSSSASRRCSPRGRRRRVRACRVRTERRLRVRARINTAQDVSAFGFPAPGRQTLRELGTRSAPCRWARDLRVHAGRDRIAFGIIGKTTAPSTGRAPYIAPRRMTSPRARSRRPPMRSLIDPRSGADAAWRATRSPPSTPPPRNCSPAAMRCSAVTKRRKALGRRAGLDQGEALERDPGGRRAAAEGRHQTVASAGGDIDSIERACPPRTMYEQSFADVLGKKPVVLSSPRPPCVRRASAGRPPTSRCSSRRSTATGRLRPAEVYEDNKVQNAFARRCASGLRTEPWLSRSTRTARSPRGSRAPSEPSRRQAVEAALDRLRRFHGRARSRHSARRRRAVRRS